MDSDTKVTILSNSPSVEAADWFLPQDQVFKTAAEVNQKAGTHRIWRFHFTPGWDAGSTKVDEAVEKYKPACEGYSVGDNTHKNSRHPWHADDESCYPFYEKISKTGIRTCASTRAVCPGGGREIPAPPPLRRRRDIGRRRRIGRTSTSSSTTRPIAGRRQPGRRDGRVDKTAGSSWTSDLAEIPEKYGVHNVYGDLGQNLRLDRGVAPAARGGADGDAGQGPRPGRIVWAPTRLDRRRRNGRSRGCRRLEIPTTCKEIGFSPRPRRRPLKTAIFAATRRGSTI